MQHKQYGVLYAKGCTIRCSSMAIEQQLCSNQIMLTCKAWLMRMYGCYHMHGTHDSKNGRANTSVERCELGSSMDAGSWSG